MPANWAVIEQRNPDDSNTCIALHVVPMVNLDGESQMSAAHELSAACPCNPIATTNKHGYPLLNHYDPDHLGALTEYEWREMVAREAAK